MPAAFPPQGRTTRSFGAGVLISILCAIIAGPSAAQDGKPPDRQKPKAVADKPVEPEAARFCANIGPSIAEARVAWETKRLADLDAQLKQRLADLEKAEASLQEWIAKRDAALKTASDDLVAVYAKMQPETAAAQIAAMDDQMAAALLSKLKPGAAGAILDEMEADRASKLATILSGASGAEKKS